MGRATGAPAPPSRLCPGCQSLQAPGAPAYEDRDLSLLLYLNEDYSGGGLTFTNFHCHFRPRTGDLLVFPSDNRYEQQAEVVQAGVRYAIASWAAVSGRRRLIVLRVSTRPGGRPGR